MERFDDAPGNRGSSAWLSTGLWGGGTLLSARSNWSAVREEVRRAARTVIQAFIDGVGSSAVQLLDQFGLETL